MADGGAAITLLGSYTPWGDILEHYGDGDFTRGYYGGLLDTSASLSAGLANGLIYVGNGQYGVYPELAEGIQRPGAS